MWYKLKRATMRVNGTEKQIRPTWIQWNGDLSKVTTSVGSFAITWNICFSLCMSVDWSHLYLGMYMWLGYLKIRQYDLSTPYDITTANQVFEFNVWGSSDPRWNYSQSLIISEDGTLLYCANNNTSAYVRTYTLSTPFDLSTATLTNTINQSSDTCISLIDNWKKYYYTINNDGTYYKELTTPYILEAGTKQNSTYYRHLTISPDWNYLYCCSSNVLKQCSIATPYDVSSTITDIVSLNGSGAYCDWYCFDATGSRLYRVQWGENSQVIYQYNLS